jgi:hypothetical protein
MTSKFAPTAHKQVACRAPGATVPAGTAVYPFHAESAALPELEDGAWRKLVPPPGAGQAQAAVLLSAPDFRQVCPGAKLARVQGSAGRAGVS